jgi:serine/threonine-protein kinase HipA
MTLAVWLNDTPVGVLEKLGDSRVVFSSHAQYRELALRPVLSQSFEDELSARSEGVPPLLPPFFSNLLPEAALRSFVLKQHKLDDRDEYGLIRALGTDLPGAVRVLEAGLLGAAAPTSTASTEPAPVPEGRVRFSLGGQFLKFSARQEGLRVVLPVEGTGGDSLLKLPDRAYPALCELEWLISEWARRSGIHVPAQRLVRESDIEGVDRALLHLGPGVTRALCATRFDRLPTAPGRVHYEDFAQVRGVYGDDQQKYAGDYAELVALIAVLCPEDLRELVRRLVFMVLSGNGDAHWKNWAIIYPDGIRPRLSPAYDLVATVAYPSLARETALKYMGKRAFSAMTVKHFASIARVIHRDEAELEAWVREDVARILASWNALEPALKLECELAFRVDDHLRSLQLG